MFDGGFHAAQALRAESDEKCHLPQLNSIQPLIQDFQHTEPFFLSMPLSEGVIYPGCRLTNRIDEEALSGLKALLH